MDAFIVRVRIPILAKIQYFMVVFFTSAFPSNSSKLDKCSVQGQVSQSSTQTVTVPLTQKAGDAGLTLGPFAPQNDSWLPPSQLFSQCVACAEVQDDNRPHMKGRFYLHSSVTM